MLPTVRAAAARSGSRRGFTLLEVGIAAAMFMVVMGVVAVASARAQFAAQAARTLSVLSSEVEFLLDRLAPEDVSSASGSYSMVSVPSPCDDDAFRTCLTVFGRPASISWTVVPGQGWAGGGFDAAGPSVTVVATAVGDRGVEVTRSRELVLPRDSRLVRLVASGPVSFEGPVFLHALSGEPLRSAGGAPVGAVVGPSGAVLLEVPEGRCLQEGECVVALSSAGSAVAGPVALSYRSASGSVVAPASGVSEHVFEVTELSYFSVLLEALLPSGERAYPSAAGSVCLHLSLEGASGWEEVQVACNTDDPRMVTFSSATVPSSGRAAALPAGSSVLVTASPVAEGSPCVSGAGRMVPSPSGWVEAPEGVDLPCSADLWGTPSGFRTSPEAPLSEGMAVLTVSGGLPVLVWAAEPPEFVPVSASGGSVSEYTQSGVTYRVHTFDRVGSSSLEVLQGGAVDFLIVGGGGGGSNFTGGAGGRGGAGGGGLLTTIGSAPIMLEPGSYPVSVGAGGQGNRTTVVNSDGGDGGISRFAGFEALGGGGVTSRPGGSGGGASLNTAGNTNDHGAGGAGTSGQGNAGGAARNGGADVGRGGGGGGAGQPGASGRESGDGGDGRLVDIDGRSMFYAGGGGGNGHPASSPGFAGRGGLGGGADGVLTGNGRSGAPGTGGGASSGGVASGNVGGDGGSGVVIVRYVVAQPSGSEVVLPATGTVGGARVDAPWSAPFDCGSPCVAPAPSVLPAAAFLEMPSLGTFGVPGVQVEQGTSVAVTVRPADRSGPVTLTLAEVSPGRSVEYRDDTLRDAYYQEPEPSGPPPPVWFDLPAGSSPPSSAYLPSGHLRLRVQASSSGDGYADLALAGASTVRLWLPSTGAGGSVVDVLSPRLVAGQSRSTSATVVFVSAAGEATDAPEDDGVVAGSSGQGAVLRAGPFGAEFDLDVFSPPAGPALLEVPGGAAAPTVGVQVLPHPARPQVTVDAPAAALQGTSFPLVVSLTDLAGAPLSGWPVWLWVEDMSGRFVRDVRSPEVACFTSPSGSCELPVEVSSSAASVTVRVSLVAGWSRSVASSAPRTLTVQDNPSGLYIDGSTVSPGGRAATLARVRTAAQSPVSGVALQASLEGSFAGAGGSPQPLPPGSVAQVADLDVCPDVLLCVATSGPSSLEGVVVLDLSAAPDVQPGVYTLTFSAGPGRSQVWRITVAPPTVSADLPSGLFVAPGGSVSLQVTLREPSGTPSRPGRLISATSPVPGVRADVSAVSGQLGSATVTMTVDEDLVVPPEGLLDVLLTVDGTQLSSPLRVPVREAARTLEIFGAPSRSAESSQVLLRIRGEDGGALGPRPARLVLPSWLTVLSGQQGCGEGLFCFDAESELALVLSASPVAPSSGTLVLFVDGVRLSVQMPVVP